MGISIYAVVMNLLKWKRGKKVKFTWKDHVIRTCAVSLMAILLLVLPLNYSVWLTIFIILILVIAIMIDLMHVRKRLQEDHETQGEKTWPL